MWLVNSFLMALYLQNISYWLQCFSKSCTHVPNKILWTLWHVIVPFSFAALTGLSIYQIPMIILLQYLLLSQVEDLVSLLEALHTLNKIKIPSDSHQWSLESTEVPWAPKAPLSGYSVCWISNRLTVFYAADRFAVFSPGRNSILNPSHVTCLPVHTLSTHSYAENQPWSTQTGSSVGAAVRESSCSAL